MINGQRDIGHRVECQWKSFIRRNEWWYIWVIVKRWLFIVENWFVDEIHGALVFKRMIQKWMTIFAAAKFISSILYRNPSIEVLLGEFFFLSFRTIVIREKGRERKKRRKSREEKWRKEEKWEKEKRRDWEEGKSS